MKDSLINSSASERELLHFRSPLCEPYTMQVRHTTSHETDSELFINFPSAPGRLPALQQEQFDAEEQWGVNDVLQISSDSVRSFNCVLCYRTHSSERSGWRHAARSAAGCWSCFSQNTDPIDCKTLLSLTAKYCSHLRKNTSPVSCNILLLLAAKKRSR